MNDLAQEAQGILQELSLLKILSCYGDARLVGSVPLDLIVKLDIDVHVLVDRPDLLEIVDNIYHSLLDGELVHQVRISDYRPEGVKIGIDKYPAASGDWSIDIWITNQVETTAFSFVEHLNRTLRPEHRSTIMKIKHHYHHQGLLHDGISKTIYQAVLDDEVQSVKEFHRYLEQMDKEA